MNKQYDIFRLSLENLQKKGGAQMTDTNRLKEWIQKSGLKQEYIAKMLNLTSYGFARKRDNLSKFNAEEIDMLCNILGINSLEDRFAIFFAKEVDCESQTG